MEVVTEVTITAHTIILETTAAATVLTGGTSKALSPTSPQLLLSLLLFCKQIQLYLRKTQNSTHKGTHEYERSSRDSAGGMSSHRKNFYRLYAFKIFCN